MVVHAVWVANPPAYRCNSSIDGAILRPSVGTGPLNGRSAAAGMKTPTSLVTPLHSIDILSGGDCRSGPAGVGYPIIPSIPRALVVVRTCRSALNMLNVCGERVGLLCCISVNASCRTCSSGCSHAQPQHKSSNSALYSAIYDVIHLQERRLEFSRCVYRANGVDQCFFDSCEDIGVETRKIACELLACDCPLH